MRLDKAENSIQDSQAAVVVLHAARSSEDLSAGIQAPQCTPFLHDIENTELRSMDDTRDCRQAFELAGLLNFCNFVQNRKSGNWCWLRCFVEVEGTELSPCCRKSCAFLFYRKARSPPSSLKSSCKMGDPVRYCCFHCAPLWHYQGRIFDSSC